MDACISFANAFTLLEKKTHEMLIKTYFFLLGYTGCVETMSVDETKVVTHSTSLHEANIYSAQYLINNLYKAYFT